MWLWNDWPNNWGPDKGIDLVAKYRGRDKFCAIQAKCYSAHNTVQYSEVSNFLADSNLPQIEDRILMMSTDRLNDTGLSLGAAAIRSIHSLIATLSWPSRALLCHVRAFRYTKTEKMLV